MILAFALAGGRASPAFAFVLLSFAAPSILFVAGSGAIAPLDLLVVVPGIGSCGVSVSASPVIGAVATASPGLTIVALRGTGSRAKRFTRLSFTAIVTAATFRGCLFAEPSAHENAATFFGKRVFGDAVNAPQVLTLHDRELFGEFGDTVAQCFDVDFRTQGLAAVALNQTRLFNLIAQCPAGGRDDLGRQCEIFHRDTAVGLGPGDNRISQRFQLAGVDVTLGGKALLDIKISLIE